LILALVPQLLGQLSSGEAPPSDTTHGRALRSLLAIIRTYVAEDGELGRELEALVSGILDTPDDPFVSGLGVMDRHMMLTALEQLRGAKQQARKAAGHAEG
jgi:hypothetical protein